jgi:cellulose synthase/poly-beta-1,6-N-acetylglucosamine synthase-like glycosyltransferase
VSVPRVSVVVPTYRRPEVLIRCLEGLAAQTLAPAEVVVVVNQADPATRAAVDALPVNVVEVAEPGVLAALRAGTASATGNWVAVLDDDAVPKPDWLECAARWFGRADIGGVGGRVLDSRPLAPPRLWRRAWAGRVTRLGLVHSSMLRPGGPSVPVETDFLPGSNMIYRREALVGDVFDPRMSFSIAPHFEADIGSCVRAAGWRLVYDPAVRVRHLPAPRGHALERGDVTAIAHAEAHNLAYHSLKHRGFLRSLPLLAFLALVGQRATPGLAFLPRRPDAVRASLRGLVHAIGGSR